MKKLLAFILGVAVLAGCATQTYTIKGNSKSFPELERSQPFFFYGIGQEQRVNAAEVCGGAEKVARVESKQKFVDGFLTLLTVGIFSPRTISVYCSK